jgi:hypothetical protein
MLNLRVQMAWAGQLPAVFTRPLVLAAASTIVMITLRNVAHSQPLTGKAWHAWQALLAIIGLVTVPQVLAGTFFGITSLWPAYTAAVPGVPLFSAFEDICAVSGGQA